MDFISIFDLVVRGFEVLGVGVLAVGSAMAFVVYAQDLRRIDRSAAYTRLRGNIGRTILLGLEILIVADIVLTVTIETTIEAAISLGIIVLVRTFLSFSLEIELDGVVPWRRRVFDTPVRGSDTSDHPAER